MAAAATRGMARGVAGGCGGLLAALLLCAVLGATACLAAVRPNIVVILSDDQRWDAFGVAQRELGAGGRLPWLAEATPRLDGLARQGFRFRNAFVVSALCAPSRAAFLTGRYNHLNGVANNHTPLPQDSTTYATALAAAGYATGYFGKWHMDSQAERPGFAEHASYVGQGIYLDGKFLVNGVAQATAGWVDDVTTDFALDFIRRQAGRPFLAVIGYKSPHHPRLPPPRLAGLFATATLAPPPSRTSYPPYLANPAPRQTGDEAIRNYARTIVGIDENIGRILAVLGALGLAEDTVLVYASDNGFLLDEHGLGDKRAAYEESIRIPLLIRYPRLGGAGRVIDAPVLNIDLAPTLLRLAGLPVPPSMQGISLVPLLRGTVSSVRSEFLYEYFHETGFAMPTMVALRRNRYKLVTYPFNPGWTQLFDLRSDPFETTNLAGSAAAQGTLATMKAALAARQAATLWVIPPFADPYP